MNVGEHQDLRTTIGRKLNGLQRMATNITAHTMFGVGRYLHAFANVRPSLQQIKTQHQLSYVISMVMVHQRKIIDMGSRINRSTRMPLLFLFFQDALAIVFNTYSIAMAYVTLVALHLSAAMSLLFYGHRIFVATLEVFLTIFGFSVVYNSINDTVLVVNELNLYVAEQALRIRLSQFAAHIGSNLRRYSLFGIFNLDGSFIYAIAAGTTTYIIILMKYEDGYDDNPAGYNDTGTGHIV